MMKITKLHLTNFRSHLDTELELSARNLIIGPNGGGKSSLLDAICYACTGVCRGTDAAGKGADQLASYFWNGEEASPAAVEVWAERDGQHHHFRRAGGQGPKSATGQEVRQTLGYDPRLVEALFRPGSFLDLPVGEQSALFVGVGKRDEDIGEVCRKHLAGLIPDELMPATLKELDALERQARDARPALKKKLAELEKKSVLEAIPESYRTAPLDGPEGLHEQLRRAMDERTSLREKMRRPEAKPTVRPGRDDVLAEYERTLATVPTTAATCPACRAEVYVVSAKTLLTTEQRDTAVADLTRMIEKRRQQVGPQAAPEPAVAEESRDDQAALAALEKLNSDLDRAVYLRAQETQRIAEVDKTKARIEKADKAVKVLAPKGPLRAELAGQKPQSSPDLVTLTQDVMRAAAWGQVTFRVDPWGLSLDGVPAALLSDSQRWRVNFAVQVALAHASGLRILVLDNTEILHQSNRMALIAALASVGSLIDQVILCTSKDPSEIGGAAPPPGWTTIYVDRQDHGGGRLYSKAIILEPVAA
jgi:hypothetical protein